MDSFPAHAIIPSEVKDDTRIRGGGHSATQSPCPAYSQRATMSCSFDVGSKMDRYEHHPMWCTMFAIAEGALAMAAVFPRAAAEWVAGKANKVINSISLLGGPRLVFDCAAVTGRCSY